MRLVLLAALLLLTTPVLAQTPPAESTPPNKAFSVKVQGLDPTVAKQLSEEEILKDVKFNVQRTEKNVTFSICKGATCEEKSGSTREALADLVNVAITQQNRLGFISNTVRRLSTNSNAIDLDRFLALLKQIYPTIDFNDPQVLKAFRKTAKNLSGYLGGILTEPSSIALFALIEPEIAVRGRLLALQNQLQRQGSLDADSNTRVQKQIDDLKAVLGEGLSGDVTDQQDKLVAMQKALKEQGVPIPSSPVGAKVLVDQLYDRFQEITKGKELPTPVDLAVIDRAGVVNSFFAKLDDRITQLENQP